VSSFREMLNAELARRRQVNPRYSVRAFAAYFGVDHSTLSQILRGRRAVPADRITDWATLLGLGPEETAVHSADADDADDLNARIRRARWLGEACALLRGPAHWQLLELLRSPDWQPDTRWVAARIGAGVDDVNDALTRLLRLGMVTIGSDGAWRDTSGLAHPDACNVRERVLERLRLAR
jgi:transcriptional regulator with XRE-family HTH domain